MFYPDGEHKRNIRTMRVRLQLLSELNVGTLARSQSAVQDAKLEQIKRRHRGAR